MKTKGILLVVVLGIIVTLVALGKWNYLIYGLFFLCPLMHIFGHNHSGNSGHDQSTRDHSSHDHKH